MTQAWHNLFYVGACTVKVLDPDVEIFSQVMARGDSATYSRYGNEYTVSVTAEGAVIVSGENVGGAPVLVIVEPAYAHDYPSRIREVEFGNAVGAASGAVNEDATTGADGVNRLDYTGLNPVTPEPMELTDLSGTHDGVGVLASPSAAMLATWEPMTKPDSVNCSLTAGNSTYLAATGVLGVTYSTFPIVGKVYFEIQLDAVAASAQGGVATGAFNRRAASDLSALWNDTNGYGAVCAICNTGAVKADAATLGTMAAAAGNSMRIFIAVDEPNREVWISSDGESGWVGGGDPAAGSSPTKTLTPNGLLWAATAMTGAGSAVLISDPADFVGTPPAGFFPGLYDFSGNPTYTTLYAANTNPAYTLSNGDKTVVGSGTTPTVYWTTCKRVKRSGKAYWEVIAKNGVTSEPRAIWGVSREGSDYYRFNNEPYFSRGYGLGGDGDAYTGIATHSPLLAGVNTNDVIRFKFDIDTGVLAAAVNGGAFSNIATGISGGGWRIAMSSYYGDYYLEGATFNFGETAFAYDVPSGYDAGWLEDQ